MNKFLQLLLAILLCQNLTQAQSTEYFDGDWKPCQEAEALYYRQITYGTDGRPEGVVRDHYIGGALQFEGRLLSVSPDVMDGRCVWYYENGNRIQEGVYPTSPLNNWRVIRTRKISITLKDE